MGDKEQGLGELYSGISKLIGHYERVREGERSPPDYCYYNGLIDGLIAVRVKLRILLEKEDTERR